MDVTVVVPFFNRASTFERLLRSVIQQSSLPSELLVVDNGSAVEEVSAARQIAASMEPPFRITFVSTSTCGNANSARNYGLELAATTYVAFLDSDDWWGPRHLQRSTEILSLSNNAGVYSGATIHDHGCVVNYSAAIEAVGGNPFSVLFSSPKLLAQSSSFVIHKQRLGSTKWDERLRRHQDYDFFLSVAFESAGWAFSPRPAVHLDRTDSISARNFDFGSMIAFLTKWSSRFPRRELRLYLSSQIEVCHIVGADKRFRDFYREVYAENFGNDFWSVARQSWCYLACKQILKKLLKVTGVHRWLGRAHVSDHLEIPGAES